MRNIVCIVVLIVLMVGCQRGSDEQKAKQLLAEMNTMMSEQEAALRSLPANAGETFSRENLSRFPDNRAQLETPAREMMRFNESSMAGHEAMAHKLDEIGALNLDENFKRYASLHAKIFRKRAEGIKTANERFVLITDESIKDQQTFQSKVEGINRRLERIDEEIKELEAQAAVIPRPQ